MCDECFIVIFFMFYCKFFFVWNFHNKNVRIFSLTTFGILKYDCVIKTTEMFNFLSVISSSVTTGFYFLFLIISNHIIKNY